MLREYVGNMYASINTGKWQKEQTSRYLPDKVLFILFNDLIPQI